jgi:class 3 adenylate cyclase
MPPVRRLAAILAADVAGYLRLMGADEEGTHRRLKAHLVDLIEPRIAEHRGRIVKNTGDGFLAGGRKNWTVPHAIDAASRIIRTVWSLRDAALFLAIGRLCNRKLRHLRAESSAGKLELD